MKITNTTNVSLSLAVWAVADDYDYDPDPSVISATGILKPLRAIILNNIAPSDQEMDVTDLLAMSMGNALHNDIEHAWTKHYKSSMLKLGYPEKVVNRIVINPDPNADYDKEMIPIYLERRTKKPLGNFIISGKFDKVMEGKLHDYKSTSVWGWIFGSNEKDHILQGSIYRWLNPNIVTQDTINIEYIFTDWSKVKAMQDSKYPQQRVATKSHQLMSYAETEQWLIDRLSLIEAHMRLTAAELPMCTPEDLWQKDPVYKYYKNPVNKKRATKNFDTMADAITRLTADGNVGVIDTLHQEL